MINSLPDRVDRILLHNEGRGDQMLLALSERSSNATVRLLALGVLWADGSGRTTGTVSLALRRATRFQMARLVYEMLRDGLCLQSQVPYWLNSQPIERYMTNRKAAVPLVVASR